MSKEHAFFPRHASANGQRHTGLAKRIYLYFLIAAVVTTAIAGIIGVAMSLETLREQTLSSLNHEMAESTGGIQLIFDQIAAEAIFLSSLPSMGALLNARTRAPNASRWCLSWTRTCPPFGPTYSN